MTKRLPSELKAAHRMGLGVRGAMAAATAAAVDPAEWKDCSAEPRAAGAKGEQGGTTDKGEE